jgi:putative colanic acid biosynthesis glycosyltransferase
MADQLRVCMVNTSATRGGAAKMAATLAAALNSSKLGVRATLYHCDDIYAANDVVGLRRPLARQVGAVLARLGGDKLIWDFGVARQLSDLAREFDVIHVHNLHGYYLNYRQLLDGLQGKPVVWTWHDMWPITGRCGFSLECTKWRTGCVSCPNLGYYPAAWTDWAARDFKARTDRLVMATNLSIVTPSRWLAELGLTRGYSPTRISVIPNPVALGEFSLKGQSEARTRLGLPNKSPLLLFVAANCDDPRKGFGDFCAIVDRTGIRGIAVGHSCARPTRLVELVGPVHSQEKLADFYSAADALVVTSSSDNYPNTTIEAQACGTPVFVYRTGGLPEQMPPFWSGVAEKHDVNGLAQLILEFLRSGGRTDRLRDSIRNHAVATWHPDVAATRYRAIYALALGQKVVAKAEGPAGTELA